MKVFTGDKFYTEGIVIKEVNDGAETWSVESANDGVVGDASLLRELEGRRVRWSVEVLDGTKTPEVPEHGIEQRIVARVRDWFKRMAPLAEEETPELTIRLKDSARDDDGTLYLYADIDETRFDRCEGRVPGEKLR